MPRNGFDPQRGVTLLGELAHVATPTAGQEEICDQALALIGKALGANGGAVFVREDLNLPPRTIARWGRNSPTALAQAAEKTLVQGEPMEERRSRGNSVSRVVLPLQVASEVIGALVLDSPKTWDLAARQFAQSAVHTLGCAVRAASLLQNANRQGELLARRNAELEVLRELASRLQESSTEEGMLQSALDLLLEKLGLKAGWILWGESKRRVLEMAASRGIDGDFARRAREAGIGHCLCQDVFQTGRQRFARNTSECPRMMELGLEKGVMSHASIPLKFERGVMGVMNIANRPGRHFSLQELQFLEMVGTQVCLAVDKARAARAENRRNLEAQALASLAKAIGGSLEQKRVLAAVGEYTRELLAADRCAIFLGDDPSNLHFAFLSGPPMSGLKMGRTADLTALGSKGMTWALKKRRAMVVPDTSEDPRGNPVLARKWEMGSAIIVPLLAHGRLGGLLVASRARASTWKEDELQLTDVLAGQAALMIESTRLYREAQEALLRLQQAQYGMMQAERLAAVGTLAASLAHEVRNPLNSINLQLVLLSRRISKLQDPIRTEISSLIETGRHEISRLDGLVEEFLSLSTIDRISPSEVHPEALLQEVITLMTPMARDRAVHIEEDFPDPLPRITMDYEKMKQVMINLVRNGIEAMPDGGTLTLASRLEDQSVCIEVSDTGTGIEPGLDIFHFFVTTKKGGTGLGLPIAQRIVEAHGGTLTFESEQGRGTTFTVTLKKS